MAADLADENHGEAGEEGVEEAQLGLLLDAGVASAADDTARRVDEHLGSSRGGRGGLDVSETNNNQVPKSALLRKTRDGRSACGVN